MKRLSSEADFKTWKFQVSIILKAKGLFKYVTSDGENTDKTEEDEFKSQEIIISNISEKILGYIVNCTSAREMWVKLCSLFDKDNAIKQHSVQQAFFNYKFENKGMIHHVTELENLKDNLVKFGDTISDELLMTKILMTLPSAYSNFQTAWESVSKDERTLSNLIQRLTLEENRVKFTETNTDNTTRVDSALFSKLKVKCFLCGQRGHMKKDCKRQNTNGNGTCQTNKNKKWCAKCKKSNHNQENCWFKDKPGNAFIIEDTSYAFTNDNDMWIIDSGSSAHMTHDISLFKSFTEVVDKYVQIGDGKELKVAGIGLVEGQTFDGVNWLHTTLSDVYYVPDLKCNLFSTTVVLMKGYEMKVSSNMWKLTLNGAVRAIGKLENKLFKLLFRKYEPGESSNLCFENKSLKDFHCILGHQNVNMIKQILKRSNITISNNDNFTCAACLYGKQHRLPFKNSLTVSKNVGDLVVADVCGPMEVKSIAGSRYFLLLKDDFSKFRTVYFMKEKREAKTHIISYLKKFENMTGHKVKILRTDNGLEEVNQDVKVVTDSLGITHQKSCAYTPQQNGKAERDLRTIVEGARTVLYAQNLGKHLWAEAVNYMTYTLNHTVCTENGTPIEVWTGVKKSIDFGNFHPFGCKVFVHVPKQRRKKWDSKSQAGIFVGYDSNVKGYRVYFQNQNKVEISRDVVFGVEEEALQPNIEVEQSIGSGNVFVREENVPDLIQNEMNTLPREEEIINVFDVDNGLANFGGSDGIVHEENVPDSSQNEMNTLPREEEIVNESIIQMEHNYGQNPGTHSEIVNVSTTSNDQNSKDKRQRKLPEKFKDYVLNLDDIAMTALLTENYELSISNDKNWKAAMADEYNSLMTMDTWELVDLPKNVKPLSCKWVLKRKDDGRFKARLVIRGFEQEEGINFFDTFSPVAQYSSIRLLLSHAASSDLKIMTFDVKTAFLYGDLDEEIYMNQPIGYDDNSGKVCKLKKSLYGLKQAPKNWNTKFSNFLTSIDFTNTDDDPCVYYNKERSIIITLFVDDGLIVAEDQTEMVKVLKLLQEKFEVTYNECGDSFTYLGMDIKKNGKHISITQEKYVDKLLKEFKLENINTVNTPMEPGFLTNKENFVNDKPLEKNNNYREMVGSLLYLSTISRPDIAFAVNYLSRFNANPMRSHMKAVKRVFQYLKGSKSQGINYNGESELTAYSDSDFGGDPVSKCSTTGVLIMRGGPILWFAQKQRLVVTSTAEAEYRAAVSSIDELCLLRRIGLELRILESEEPTTLYIDNQSAIHMLKGSKEGKISKGKKHIEISKKFIQHHIDKTVNLSHIISSEQLADIFTKPLTRKLFEEIRDKIMTK